MSEPAAPLRRPMPSPPDTPPRQAGLVVLRALREAGFVSYFAGGCVRDALLGQTPKDYDVATEATPDQVRALFRAARAVGESFGVLLVRRQGVTVEVATFRREWGYTDKRRPDAVAFSDAADDASRRDFTINALFEDPLAGEVLDYVGGLTDLEARRVRAVGNPFQRLEEDHLRALRAVRFAARLGFEIEAKTADAIRLCARHLAGVSRERIGEELRHQLMDAQRATALRLMQELGVDAPVLREESRVGDVPTVAALPDDATYPLALAAWACDRHPDFSARQMAAEARRLVGRWRRSLMLSNAERDAMAAILHDLVVLEEDWSHLPVARRKRLAATSHFEQTLSLAAARNGARANAVAASVQELAVHAGGLQPEPLVTGDDLIEMGLTPGPLFGRVLEEVYDAQLEGRVSEASAARSLAQRLAASR
jgi:poly(A) polymerase